MEVIVKVGDLTVTGPIFAEPPSSKRWGTWYRIFGVTHIVRVWITLGRMNTVFEMIAYKITSGSAASDKLILDMPDVLTGQKARGESGWNEATEAEVAFLEQFYLKKKK